MPATPLPQNSPHNSPWTTPPQDCEILDSETTEKLARKFSRINASPVPPDAPGYCFRQARGG